jgi:hypothetical protein
MLVLRTFALAVLCASLVAASGAEAAPDNAAQAFAAQRALAIYALMEHYFYVPAERSYDGTYPASGDGHAQVWPYGQALGAALAVAQLPGARAVSADDLLSLLASLGPYRAPLRGQLAYAPLYGGKGNVFYDDNVWIGLDLVQASTVLHDPAALAAAERVFSWLTTGWDASASACPGGIYWLMPGGPYWNHSVRNRYRAAVSTANFALLGALLYERNGDRADLRWAERAYAWTGRCLGDGDGLVGDHIDALGNVAPAYYSYNEGAMVATAVNLYRVTRQRTYLEAALRTTDAALTRFQSEDGTGEPASFLAIFYQDLVPLMPLADAGSIRHDLAAFAARAWADERDPTTGLFHFGHTYATLLDQSAMVEVYAELATT